MNGQAHFIFLNILFPNHITLSSKVSVVAKPRHIVRNDGTDFKAKRRYFKSKSRIPIEDGHHDRDSDDESTGSWYHEYRDAVSRVDTHRARPRACRGELLGYVEKCSASIVCVAVVNS